ncbi:DUF4215 domain-containing protein [Labilithrix luteola]|uniref:DUF4215 domain-containing protein n=1 Tax=Labilithrix luteola TaxID=1391654 RepID=UPI001F0B659E|nr:DUF4215 domain-containing protein [Labilithrix luteola]
MSTRITAAFPGNSFNNYHYGVPDSQFLTFKQVATPITQVAPICSNTATCDADCSVASCGDGFTNSAAGEECDDGNTDDTDGCLSTCVSATCGDGKVQAGVEQCDNGNTDDDDRGARRDAPGERRRSKHGPERTTLRAHAHPVHADPREVRDRARCEHDGHVRHGPPESAYKPDGQDNRSGEPDEAPALSALARLERNGPCNECAVAARRVVRRCSASGAGRGPRDRRTRNATHHAYPDRRVRRG